MPGAFFDFGLYLFHNHAALKARGTGPYFYLPKLENHREARLWDDVLGTPKPTLGIAPQTIKVTVLIETILAAFEMDEILYELQGPHRRPQLRPLGLHLQLHQEIQPPAGLRAAGSPAGDDDDALPALVLEAR